MIKKLIVLLTTLLSPLLLAEESLRLVVSAGALSGFDPYSLFYSSRIFIGEEHPPFVIKNGNAKAFETEHTVFYSSDDLSIEDILSAKHSQKAERKLGLSGTSYQAYSLEGNAQQELARYLGAEEALFVAEVRAHSDGKKIVAMSKDTKNSPVIWPKSHHELTRVPAVIIGDATGTFQYLVRARKVADMSHRLGLIDHIMAKSGNKKALLDLGSNHGGHTSISPEIMNAFFKRNPKAIFPGTNEMAYLLSNVLPSNVPLIYPIEGKQHKAVSVDGRTINLWSAQGTEKLWSLYGKLGKPIRVDAMINEMKREVKNPDDSLNIVRVFSEEAAKETARSVYVDLVLLLAQDPFIQLPSKEVIELKQAKTDAYEQIAPIVKVSYLDVSEVTLLGPKSNILQRVEIHRHPISDDRPLAPDVPEISDMSDMPELAPLADNKPWGRDGFEKLLGGIMLKESGADIALFEAKPYMTPIFGGLSFDLAKSLLSPAGNIALLTITGKQIKKINRVISGGTLSRNIAVYGMNAKGQKIGDRMVNDNERFSVAVSEQVLLELFGISMMGGLGDEYSIRAPFVEAIYGDLKSIYFIAGPKVIPLSDTQEHIAEAVKMLHTGRSFDDIITSWFASASRDVARLLTNAKGEPHHVITFDLSYFDFGISTNITNKTYDDFGKKKALPMGRGGVPSFTHIFVFAKAALTYDAPSLVTTLSGEVKYLHVDMGRAPEKDKTKIGLKFRLPWERSLFSDSSVVVSPLFKGFYETKLTPSFWADNEEIRKKPRTSRIDSLLGVNIDFTRLGFNIDVGGVMANDFNRTNFYNATDFGPGLNFMSKWSLFGPVELSSDISSYYLFALPQNTIPDKLAMGIEGTVWLRLARFYDFSIAAVNDFLVATLQNDPKNVAVSSIFGLTISYGRLFRLHG